MSPSSFDNWPTFCCSFASEVKNAICNNLLAFLCHFGVRYINKNQLLRKYILGLKLRYWVHLIVDIFVNVFADVFGGTFSGLGCSSYPLEDREGSRCVVDSKVLVQVEHNLKTCSCKWFCNQRNNRNITALISLHRRVCVN